MGESYDMKIEKNEVFKNSLSYINYEDISGMNLIKNSSEIIIEKIVNTKEK